MPKYLDGAGLSRFWNNIKRSIGSASQEQVDAWLDNHPEATTTVQDGAVTTAKLAKPTFDLVGDGQRLLNGIGAFRNNALKNDGTIGTGEYGNYRVASADVMTFNRDIVISIEEGYRWYYLDFSGSTPKRVGWFTCPMTMRANTPFKMEIAKVAENTQQPADTYEFLSKVKIDSNIGYAVDGVNPQPKTFSSADFGNGLFENGALAWGWDKRLVTPRLFPVTAGNKITYSIADGFQVMLAVLDSDTLVSLNSPTWITPSGTQEYVIQHTGLFALHIKRVDGTAIAATDYDGNITLEYGVSNALVPSVAGLANDERSAFSTSEEPYFEPNGRNGGMWVRFSGEMWIRGRATVNTGWANLPASWKVTTTKGVSDCVLIPHNNSFVYNTSTSTFEILQTVDIAISKHIPILKVGTQGTSESVFGGIGYHTYVEFIVKQNDSISTDIKAREYAALVNSSANTEQFAYFTDPHLTGYNGATTGFLGRFDNYLDTLKQYVDRTPVTFTLCGGDWLNSDETETTAKWKLGLAYGAGNRLKRFYNTVGNHDTGYDETDASPITLPNQTINNAMFGGEHPNYYTFDGANTRFYVFDSGKMDLPMTDYRWEQIAWFANALKDEDKAHSAVSIHIWYTSGDASSNNISTFAVNITSVINAYNSRGDVTLNGVSYSFAGCTGHVEFVICGHTHYDKSGVAAGIPVINTLNMPNGNTPSFDLVYVDYDNREINTVRVGTGSNRTFALATF